MLGFVLFSNDRFYPYEVEEGGGGLLLTWLNFNHSMYK